MAHHRRRLRRLGWSTRSIRAPGCGPRPSRRRARALAVRVLIDGAEALPRMAEALSGARSHVSVAGWQVTPGFSLTRNGTCFVIRDLLAELAERMPVRVVLWAGAPLPVFRPWRLDALAALRAAHRRTRGYGGAGQPRAPAAHTPREDGGGRRGGRLRGRHRHHRPRVDRFDAPPTTARARLARRGRRAARPCSGRRRRPPALRWARSRRTLPVTPPAAAGDVQAQLVATIPERRYARRRHGSFRILEAYLRAIRAARTSSTWRTSSCGRRRSWRRSATSSPNRPRATFAWCPAARATQQRRDDTRGSSAYSRRPTPAEAVPGLLPLLPRRWRVGPGRTSMPRWASSTTLAHGGLLQPQRPLPLQRHRGEHGRRATSAWRGTRACAVDRTPRDLARGAAGRPRERHRESWKPIADDSMRAAGGGRGDDPSPRPPPARVARRGACWAGWTAAKISRRLSWPAAADGRRARVVQLARALVLLDGVAAVDDHQLAGDVAGVVRGQEADETAHLVGERGAAQRRVEAARRPRPRSANPWRSSPGPPRSR